MDAIDFELLLASFLVILVIPFVFIQFGHLVPFKTPRKSPKKKSNITPVSVNYHFTRKCNYECGFCFHTAKTSFVASLGDAKIAMGKLAEKGMRKLNLSGGEPFLYPDFIGEITRFCKEELKLESVSIVSNGSKVTEKWFKTWGKYLDILAISVDSFNEETNILIGRGKSELFCVFCMFLF